MGEFLIMLKNVVLFVLLAIPGYLLVKTKHLKSSDSGVLTTILLYLGLPFMILVNTINIQISAETIKGILLTIVIFAVGEIALILLSKIFSKFEPLDDQRRMARFCMIIPNNGLIGLPLALAIFEGTSLSIVIVYVAVANVLTNVLWPTYGNYLLSNDKKHISAKGLLTNFVLIAFILGVILNLLGFDGDVKDIVVDYSNHLKGVVVALSMTILGMKFADAKITKLFTSLKVYYVSFVRLILSPVLIVGVLLLINLVISIDKAIIIGAYITFSMPVAPIAAMLSDKFGMDSENGVLYTSGSTLFSVVTIPVLYLLLNLII